MIDPHHPVRPGSARTVSDIVNVGYTYGREVRDVVGRYVRNRVIVGDGIVVCNVENVCDDNVRHGALICHGANIGDRANIGDATSIAFSVIMVVALSIVIALSLSVPFILALSLSVALIPFSSREGARAGQDECRAS